MAPARASKPNHAQPSLPKRRAAQSALRSLYFLPHGTLALFLPIALWVAMSALRFVWSDAETLGAHYREMSCSYSACWSPGESPTSPDCSRLVASFDEAVHPWSLVRNVRIEALGVELSEDVARAQLARCAVSALPDRGTHVVVRGDKYTGAVVITLLMLVALSLLIPGRIVRITLDSQSGMLRARDLAWYRPALSASFMLHEVRDVIDSGNCVVFVRNDGTTLSFGDVDARPTELRALTVKRMRAWLEEARAFEGVQVGKLLPQEMRSARIRAPRCRASVSCAPAHSRNAEPSSGAPHDGHARSFPRAMPAHSRPPRCRDGRKRRSRGRSRGEG